MFIAALFTIGKIWKQTKSLSMDEWIKKMWGIPWSSGQDSVLSLPRAWVQSLVREQNPISHVRSQNKQTNKQKCGIRTMKYYPAMRKKEILSFFSNMDGPK